MHTYIRTHTHTYILTYIHTHSQIHKYIYTYIQTNIHTNIHTYIHIFDCPLLENRSDKDKNWPVSCNKLGVQYHKKFKEYIDNISCNEEHSKSSQ